MVALASEILVPFPFLAEVAAFPSVGEGRERRVSSLAGVGAGSEDLYPLSFGAAAVWVVAVSSPLIALSLPLFFSPKLLLLL